MNGIIFYDETKCPVCKVGNMEWWDSGRIGEFEWNAYKCKSCGFIDSDEHDLNEYKHSKRKNDEKF